MWQGVACLAVGSRPLSDQVPLRQMTGRTSQWAESQGGVSRQEDLTASSDQFLVGPRPWVTATCRSLWDLLFP